MSNFRRNGNLVARITIVILALLWGPPSGQAQVDDEYGHISAFNEDDRDIFDGPEVREPLFALALHLAETDSLGHWQGADILAFADSLGRESQLPVVRLKGFTRRRPTQVEAEAWPGVRVDAIWDIDLGHDVNEPMPYSILGYHPGTLRISGKLKLAETRLPVQYLSHERELVGIRDTRLFRLEAGHLILDVDGWVDFLLGKGLDDGAVLALASGRGPEGLVALAVSVGREGRRIYGEFDLRQDKVLPNGRPLASQLSRKCRAIVTRGIEDPISHGWGKAGDR